MRKKRRSLMFIEYICNWLNCRLLFVAQAPTQLLKEVSSLLVDVARFEITYDDGEKENYNYTADSSGRITGINKLVS
ncbi:hypothetical protein [Filibacter tadaridae]